MIQVVCEECGKIVFRSPVDFRRRKQHFCSRKCHMVYMNRIMNPERMTPEVREKLRNAKLGTGEGKLIPKRMEDIHTELLQKKNLEDH